MAVAYVTKVSANTGTSSAATVSVTIPSGVAQIGDVAITLSCAERGLIPTISFPTTGYTAAQSVAQGTQMATECGWKRLVAGDLGGNVIASVTTIRRMSIGVALYRGALDPVFLNAAFANATDLSAEMPDVIPSQANSMLVGVMAAISNVSPFIRSFSPSSASTTAGWTERIEEGSSSTAGSNAYSYIGDRLVSGGAGVSQTGLAVTEATAFVYYPTTVALAPQTAISVPPGWDEVQLYTRT